MKCSFEHALFSAFWTTTLQILAKGLMHTHFTPEEVGHGLKGIMAGRISESRTLFYHGHEINMAGF